MDVSTLVETRGTPAVDALASAFRALGEPTRLRILAALAGGTRCVCEIQAVVEVPGNLLSHHLKVLREAGLIEGARRGRWIDYTLKESALGELATALPPDPRELGLDLARCADACARAEGVP